MVNLNDLTARRSVLASQNPSETGEIILEREEVLAKLEEELENKKARIRESYQARISAIEAARNERLKKRTETIDKEGALRIYEQLVTDSQTLTDRAALAELPTETLAIVGKLPNWTPLAQQTITSYIGRTGEGTYTLLVPLKENRNKTALLNKNLEDKIDDVLSLGGINPSINITISEETRLVQKSRADSVVFNADQEEPLSEFQTYKITCTVPCTNLAELIKNKFEDTNVQPANFKKVELTHRIMVVGPSYLDYFRNHDMANQVRDRIESEATGIGFTHEEVAEKLGYKLRGVRVLASKGILEAGTDGLITPGSLIRYATKRKIAIPGLVEVEQSGQTNQYYLDRIAAYGTTLTLPQAKDALEIGTYEGIRTLVRRWNINVVDSPEGLTISQTDLREALSRYQKTGRGWMKKED